MASGTQTTPKTYEEALAVVAELNNNIEQRDELIAKLSADMRLLKEQLLALRRRQFGPSSDRFTDPNQLALFEATQPAKAPEAPPRKPSSGKGRRNGRSAIPSHLRREREVLDLAEDDRVCPDCDEPMTKFGEEVTEELCYKPAELFVKQIVRPKYACAKDGSGVLTAPLPPRVVTKGRPGVSLLVHVLVAKYLDHLPLYRIETQLKRHGMKIHRSTLCDWVGAVVRELERIVEIMRYQLTRGRYLQADDTPVNARDANVKRKMRKVYFFAYGVPWGEVVYQYRTNRSHEGPLEFLEGFEGKVQVDEYSGYNALFEEGSGRTRVGCLAHARRKFVEAEQSEPERTRGVLQVLRGLYHLESLMRERGYAAGERLRVRQRIHRRAAEKLKATFVEEIHDATILPQSLYGKAIRYFVNHWDHLAECFDDGELELDNNGIESAIRPLALGRKNWLHLGDVNAGDRAAVLYSLLNSCKRLGIDPQEYLTDVLTRLPGCPASEIIELTPTEWKKARQSEQQVSPPETAVS